MSSKQTHFLDYKEHHTLQASKSLGIITRRPEKSNAFARKRHNDRSDQILHENYGPPRAIQNHSAGNIDLLEQRKSLEQLKLNIEEENKFLSHKNDRNAKINSPNMLSFSHNEKSPKFMRKNAAKEYNSEKFSSLQQISINSHNIYTNQFTPTLSNFSLESVVGKEHIIETSNTSDQWRQIKQQKDQLYTENITLKKEITLLKSQIDKLKLEKPKMNPSFRCRNCQKLCQMESKYKKELSKCQFVSNQYKKQLDSVKHKRNEIEKQFRELAKAQKDFIAEIADKNAKMNQLDKENTEFKTIIKDQQLKLQSNVKIMESLGIQLHVLLRRKQKCQVLKKQAVRKLQAKVTCLQKLLRMNKSQPKPKAQDQFILDLSSDFQYENPSINIK